MHVRWRTSEEAKDRVGVVRIDRSPGADVVDPRGAVPDRKPGRIARLSIVIEDLGDPGGRLYDLARRAVLASRERARDDRVRRDNPPGEHLLGAVRPHLSELKGPRVGLEGDTPLDDPGVDDQPQRAAQVVERRARFAPAGARRSQGGPSGGAAPIGCSEES